MHPRLRSAVVLHAAQHTVATVQIPCCVDWLFHQHCFVAASSAKLRYPNQTPISDDSVNGFAFHVPGRSLKQTRSRPPREFIRVSDRRSARIRRASSVGNCLTFFSQLRFPISVEKEVERRHSVSLSGLLGF